jgi:hypothetical protein
MKKPQASPVGNSRFTCISNKRRLKRVSGVLSMEKHGAPSPKFFHRHPALPFLRRLFPLKKSRFATTGKNKQGKKWPICCMIGHEVPIQFKTN